MKTKNMIILTVFVILISGFTTDVPVKIARKVDSILLFIGTYTESGKSQGIYMYDMNTATGSLTYLGVSPHTTNPSYLAIHPNHQWIYAVNEMEGTGGKYLGGVSAFRIDSDHKKLIFLNMVPSHGNDPCYVSVDQSGKYVMTANYGNGSVAMFPVNKDGSLSEASYVDQHRGKGPNMKRQEGPHAHMITQGYDGRFVYCTDLGTDKVLIYKIDEAEGTLIPTSLDVSVHPGAGPRHLAFHPNRNWVYVINELNGTIEAFILDKLDGSLNRFQTISTLAKDETREPGAAEIKITPDGKFLYATNRAEINNIVMYAVNQESGILELIGSEPVKGKTPRDFAIDPSGTFLLVANQHSDNIVTFRIDPLTGKLTETGIEVSVPSPVCLKFME